MSEHARYVTFEGNVQGVGFRYTAQRLAGRHQISGWVRNLCDGRVELFAQGKPEYVRDYLDGIRANFSRHIHKTLQEERDCDQGLSGFRIRY
ncbi:MAG: acylphosphatase [Candidatus Omnitrophica bacterium]|nr:acylphosphatase [Candidatus Omnitrophota bacterium]